MLTLRSTVAFFFLFLMLDLAFLMLGIAYLDFTGDTVMTAAPNTPLLRAGGAFGILSAFAAWYDSSMTIRKNLFSNHNTGTTPSPVWPTPATPSSSSQSPTSPGPRRAASNARRSTTAKRAPSSRSKRMTTCTDQRIYMFCKDNMKTEDETSPDAVKDTHVI